MITRTIDAGALGKLTIRHNLDSVIKDLSLTQDQVRFAKPKILNLIGTKVLVWGWQDYRKRSEGKMAAGVMWDDISEGAIISRLIKRAPYKRLVAQMQGLSGEDDALQEQLRRMMPKGKGAALNARRAAIAVQFEQQHPELQALRKKRAAIRTKKRTMIEKESAAAKIGVDTGRLISSLQFGKKGNRFSVRQNSITVGSTIKYAKYFDKARKIFPVSFMNNSRQRALEQDVKEQVERIYKKGLEKKNG